MVWLKNHAILERTQGQTAGVSGPFNRDFVLLTIGHNLKYGYLGGTDAKIWCLQLILTNLPNSSQTHPGHNKIKHV